MLNLCTGGRVSHLWSGGKVRYYYVFASSFGGDSTPCISHESIDRVKTLCGLLCADAATDEPDDNDLEADCARCRRASQRLRGLDDTMFVVCPYCERTHRVNLDGTVRKHISRVVSHKHCHGSGQRASGMHVSTINMSGLPASIVPK
jgi:hypothetical protein